DQQSDPGQWNVLGEYEFSGTAYVVIYSNSEDCSTSVDGVRFVVDDTRFVVDDDRFASTYDDTLQTSSSCRISSFLSENSFYKSVIEGETVILDDVDNLEIDYDIVEYHWEQLEGSPVTLSDSSAAVPTFTAPLVDEDGTELSFVVEVRTADNLCDTAEISIVIENDSVRSHVANTDNGDSGGCFISTYTESVSGFFSEKTILFYNFMALLLAILSLYLIYSLNKKI
ncbi:MAG: hypothetical protein JRF40_11390, partial [Deltaproteobacteria bacterium]|nr:hypothetical protein [Deltaproteobacteria bacterium]